MMDMETGGDSGTNSKSNSNDPDDEESGGDGGSSSSGDGSTTGLKDRAAKETKRTLARSETRAGTLRQDSIQ